jgi:hypothetical protein
MFTKQKKAEAAVWEKLAMDSGQANANEAMDMPAHEKTYKNFTGFVKFSIAFVVLVLVGMAIFLT